MNKICTWSQTYGNDREELFEWRKKDLNLLNFINKFDTSILSFHNSSVAFKKKIIKNNFYKEYMSWDNISYPISLLNSLNCLKSAGYTKILFLQDDVFTTQKDKNYYDVLFDYIKNNNFNMINLEDPFKEIDDLSLNKKIKDNAIFLKNNIIFKTTIQDKLKIHKGYYSFDDGAYCADIDYLLKYIYDDNYFNMPNIWLAENYLQKKHNSTNYDRYILNTSLFCRVAIVGKTIHKEHGMNFLTERFNNEN